MKRRRHFDAPFLPRSFRETSDRLAAIKSATAGAGQTDLQLHHSTIQSHTEKAAYMRSATSIGRQARFRNPGEHRWNMWQGGTSTSKPHEDGDDGDLDKEARGQPRQSSGW